MGLAGLVSQPASALRLGDTIEAVAKPIEGLLSPNNWRPSHPDRPTPPSRPDHSPGPNHGHSNNQNSHSNGQPPASTGSNDNVSEPQSIVAIQSTPVPVATPEPIVVASQPSASKEASNTQTAIVSRPLSMATMPKSPVRVVSSGSDHYDWDVRGSGGS